MKQMTRLYALVGEVLGQEFLLTGDCGDGPATLISVDREALERVAARGSVRRQLARSGVSRARIVTFLREDPHEEVTP